MEWVDGLLKKFRNQIKFSPAKDPYITLKLRNENQVLAEIQEFLKTIETMKGDSHASNYQ